MKWLVRGVVAVLAVLVVLVIGIYGYTGSRLHEPVEIPAERLKLDLTAGDPVEGKRLATTRGCVDCHGDRMQGRVLIDEPPIGLVAGPNLTQGNGSVTTAYRDEDWVRSVRFGVNPKGRKLIFMPSHEFYHVNDADLASLISYIRSTPPVDNQSPITKVGPVARALYVAGKFPMFLPYENINMSETPINAEKGATAEYGRYLTTGCTGCHGVNFKGGPIPGVPPSWPPASDISSSGAIGKWSLDQMKQTMRTGTTPEGKKLDPMYMPWPNAAAMNDQELEAIYLFLRSVSP